MKNKKIPKSFTLGGLKFNIEMKKEVSLDNVKVGGASDGCNCVIEIAETVGDSKCSSDFQRQTFYHELTHQILEAIGEFDLSANEKFVQSFSLLLDQFEQTKEF